MKTIGTGKFWALSLIVLLWGISFALACRLTSHDFYDSDAAPTTWNRILGSAAALLSENLYERADLYFHKGVPHQSESAFSDPFQKLGEVVAPTSHMHADTREDKLEIMPWLSLATKADPHNVEAYQVAIYWLKSVGKLDTAEDVLREALADNPGDYRLQLERGLIGLARDDYGRAARALDTALRQWPKPLGTENEEALLDLGRILRYRALIAESEGQPALAAELLRREYRVFPEREKISEDIERLQSGQTDPSAARHRLALLQKAGDEMHECNRHADH